MRGVIYGALIAAIGLWPAAPALAGKSDDTLNAAFAAEPEPLDNYKIAGREGLILARHVFDGLLYKDLDTGEIKPALAKAWRFADPMTMEFDLREGVTLPQRREAHRGRRGLHAQQRGRPEYGARYRIAVDWIDKVEKIADDKVRIRMSKPFAGAVEMLADALSIYPQAYFKEDGSAGMAAKPVGTGPYRLVEMAPGTRYVFERFDDHYAGSPKGKPAIKRIVVRTIPEMNTQYAELGSGRLDWSWRIPPDQARRVGTLTTVQVVSAPIMRVAYVGFAVKHKDKTYPTSSVKVRQAINHAINRKGITDAFAGGRLAGDPCRLQPEAVRLRAGRDALRLRSRKGEEIARRGRLGERPRHRNGVRRHAAPGGRGDRVGSRQGRRPRHGQRAAICGRERRNGAMARLPLASSTGAATASATRSSSSRTSSAAAPTTSSRTRK